MRILHTADWHAGRVWRGRRRSDELEAVLEDLAHHVEVDEVDLVLVAGDVFDQRHPPAWAVDPVLRCLRRMGESGARTVLVSGNHDSRSRLAAWSRLTDLVGVATFVTPTPDSTVEIEMRTGETAIVAAAPFAPMRTLVGALELARDEEGARRTWADTLRRILERQSEAFREDAVNLLVGHLAVDGARVGGSESRPLRGGEWTLSAADLPSAADYVALGHIHRRQRVPGEGEVWYCGSPFQLDFSEVGQEKGCLRIDARPGEVTEVSEVALEGGRPLVDVGPCTLEELEERREDLDGEGWLRVTIAADELDPDLATRVRRLLPGAVVVRRAPRVESVAEPAASRRGRSTRDLYLEFHQQRHGQAASEELMKAFDRLEAEATAD